MKRPLQYLLVTIIIVTTSPLQADPLCNASCELSIDFTNAGSIEAVAPLVITFGNNGVLDTGAGGTINAAVQPASTDFSAGGVLSLAAGESISFGAGGEIVLGHGGNIDYTEMDLVVDGDVDIAAVGGAQSITWSAGTITINGGTFNIASDLVHSGTLDLNAGVITGSGSVTQGSTGLITSATGSLDSSAGTLSVSQISSGLQLTTSTLTPGNTIDIDAGSLTPTPGLLTDYSFMGLTSENLVDFEGVVLGTVDGATCTVSSGECLTSDGVRYIVNENSELVLADEGGGALAPITLLAMSSMLAGLRQRRRLHMR